MDQGARFYRCDFQVHSPRDRNWRGERPVGEEPRMAFAKRFVAACRQKGLQAGRIKLCGAIDVEAIRNEITAVMEEGQEAFRLRKEKYGF